MKEKNYKEDHFIIDRKPLEVCKLSRSGRNRICRDALYSSPNKRYCASQTTRYYGYKLHATCSVSGIFQSMDRSPAPEHDIHHLKDIKAQLKDCTLIREDTYRGNIN